jgi:TonB family protein
MKSLFAFLSFALVCTGALAQGVRNRPDFQGTKIVRAVMPDFPEPLYRLYRNGGEVRIDIAVDMEGKLTEWLAVAYTDRRFADLAIEALKKWEFEPARWEGQPVPVCIPLTFSFEVKGVVLSSTGEEMAEAWLMTHFGGTNAYRPCTLRELDRIPIPVHADAPHYPESLANRGVQGEVTVEFYIDETGAVRMPFVIDLPQADLANLAVLAVRDWKFEPPTCRGRPVLARVRQLFRFTPTPVPANAG